MPMAFGDRCRRVDFDAYDQVIIMPLFSVNGFHEVFLTADKIDPK